MTETNERQCDWHCHWDYSTPLPSDGGFRLVNVLLPKCDAEEIKIGALLSDPAEYCVSLMYLPEHFEASCIGDALSQCEQIASFVRQHPGLGVGECGVDKRFGDLEKQRAVFEFLTDLAVSEGRPLTVHSVRSLPECEAVLSSRGAKRVLFHRFSGTWQDALRFARRGWKIGIGPQNAHRFTSEEIATLRGMGAVLPETDEYL